MKLYHNPRSRSVRPNWLIEELGLDVERVHVEFSPTGHKGPEFLAINPLGQLPAYTEGDTVITEAAAICLYLADTYGARLRPSSGPASAAYYRWMIYPIGTLEPRAMDRYRATQSGDDGAVAKASAALDAAVEVVADALGDGPWLLGEQFTAADIMTGALMIRLARLGACTLPPNVAEWCARLSERPAWKRASAGA